MVMFSTYMCILRHLVQINSKLAWECNQFVMKLADGMQLVWVAGCAGFDGNEIADHFLGKAPQICLQGQSLPLAYLHRLQG